MRNPSWMRAVLAGMLVVVLVALVVRVGGPGRTKTTAKTTAEATAEATAETTAEAYRRLAGGIAYLPYRDVLWVQVPSPQHLKDDLELKRSWENYQQAMALPASLGELTELAADPEPKVRTLALMRLYDMEDPVAFRVLYTRLDDSAATFPVCENDELIHRMVVESKPRTVGGLARLMAEQAGELRNHPDDPALLDQTVGWYRYLYYRATGGDLPIPQERAGKRAALRSKIDRLPAPTRDWMLLALGPIHLDINEWNPRAPIPLFATEEELLAASKELGPGALLDFVRDGTRLGLREKPRKFNGAEKDRNFILAHAGQLFRGQDAEALAAMGQRVAAVDADPEQAGRLLREELKQEKSEDRQGIAAGAMVDLCGDAESEFIAQWFYQASERAHLEFINELGRRNPRQWRKAIGAIAADPQFERLERRTLYFLTDLTTKWLGSETPASKPDLSMPALRNLQRTQAGLPQVDEPVKEAPSP
jgi:hypothetical protein